MFPISDTKSTGRFPFWTVLIILLNVYVFYLELSLGDSFIEKYALVPSQIDLYNLDSLKSFITSQFLHGGFIHILSNMYFLWIFGDNTEGGFGFFIFPFVYILSGIAGGVSQFLLSPTSSIPMLGASGAIAGVLGAYYVMFPHHSIKTLVPVFGFLTIVNLPASFMIIYWFLTQLFAGAASVTQQAIDVGGVAYIAHIGGFIMGVLLAKLLWPRQYKI